MGRENRDLLEQSIKFSQVITNKQSLTVSQHQVHPDDPEEVVLRVQQLLLQQLPAKRAGLQNSNLLKVTSTIC